LQFLIEIRSKAFQVVRNANTPDLLTPELLLSQKKQTFAQNVLDWAKDCVKNEGEDWDAHPLAVISSLRKTSKNCATYFQVSRSMKQVPTPF